MGSRTAMVETFEVQARACAAMGSPMYAALLHRAADDLAAGGVVADVLRGQEQAPATDVVPLRLLGSVHRLVLERRAGELSAFYPSVGGTWEPEGGWRAFARLLADQPGAVGEWLDRPPQTNEVGRSAALYGGLLQLPRSWRERPVRLAEIGASAGLNLRPERFGYTDEDGGRYGDPDAAVVLEGAWNGRRLEEWPHLRVVARAGCDVRPVDAATTEGRLVLTAYVWPDQRHRLERLRGALAMAAAEPVEVTRADACSWLRGLALADGVTTVLWHSVMWQYLTPEDRDTAAALVEELGDRATATTSFAHLRLEPVPDAAPGQHRFLVHLRVWPGGGERLLGETDGHGMPTTWLPATT